MSAAFFVRAGVVAAVALSLLTGAPGVVPGGPPPAAADTSPADPALPATVAADALPTAQINGVVWTQLIVGGTVFVGGAFTAARPAGSPAGSNQVARSNLLAYDLTSGALLPFAPTLNGQVKDLAASPDGRTLYVAGQFTTVNGQGRYRVAAFDVATGALSSTFRPVANAAVNTVAATGTTVFLGGTLTSVNNQARTKVAAVSAATGATLPFTATVPNGTVQALTVAPDGASLVIGGSFTSVNGSSNPGYGLARLNATTGASLPLPVNTYARDGGANAAILSLETDGTNFYGTGYVFGSGGNVEGTFAGSWATGGLVWIEDCHGDTYSAFPSGGAVYIASHKHYCGNTGGFPQTTPWTFYRATAVTTAATGVNTPDYWGYVDHRGQPAPTFLTWYPAMNAGTYTGLAQGPWSVTANADYVLFGGEFTQVSGRAQQGLVRFAVSSIAPDQVGPRRSGTPFPLVATGEGAGAVRLTWRSNDDPDNQTLTYRLYRAEQTLPPVNEQTVTTEFWRTIPLTFLDTGLPPGSTQRYRLVAVDAAGNQAWSAWVNVVVPSGTTASTYAATVLADRPAAYWRMGEPSGAAIADLTGFYAATAQSGVTRGVPGALAGDGSTATTFSGTTSGYASSTLVGNAPEQVSVEAWVRTTTTRGGKIVGFGANATGTSTGADRQLYMDNLGRLYFGMQSGSLQVVTGSTRYNDGAWHHVVGTYAAGTMRLYVDGVQISQRSDVVYQRAYWGYWRIGGDRLTPWPNAPTSEYIAATLDEVAVYHHALSADRVAAHHAAGRATTPPVNQPPLAAISVTTAGLSASLDGGGSTDPDGMVTGWSWDLGDGTSATGPTVSHTYAAPGDYLVRLVVTDDDAATGATTRTVSVSDLDPVLLAQDGFTRTVVGGWGDAEVGGAWSSAGPAAQLSVDGARGLHLLGAGATASTWLGATATDADLTVTVSLDKVPGGSGAFVHLQARRVAATTFYGGRLRLNADGSVQLHVTRGNGTPIAGGVVPGLTLTAGTQLQVRVQVTGTSPTTVRTRVWPAGQAEPTTWLATATDSTSGLQVAGSVGLSTYLFGNAGNAPLTIGFDDLTVGPTG